MRIMESTKTRPAQIAGGTAAICLANATRQATTPPRGGMPPNASQSCVIRPAQIAGGTAAICLANATRQATTPPRGGIGLISSDKILEMCMDKRTDAFLDEVARVGTDPFTLGISIAVIWNLDMARLQVSSRFIDGDMNIIDTNMIVMRTISENPHLQMMIHPLDGGPGDLPPGTRKRVIFKLGEFFQKARDRNIGISSVTCGRATLWLHNEQEWKDKLIAANDGGRMIIMPSTQ